MKSKAQKEEFKAVAKLMCGCGCGKSVVIERDIKTGEWIILRVKSGFKYDVGKEKIHIGYDLLLKDPDTKKEKLINFLETILTYLKTRRNECQKR